MIWEKARDEMSCASCVTAARYAQGRCAPLVAATIAKIAAHVLLSASGRSNRPVRRRRSTATAAQGRHAYREPLSGLPSPATTADALPMPARPSDSRRRPLERPFELASRIDARARPKIYAACHLITSCLCGMPKGADATWAYASFSVATAFVGSASCASRSAALLPSTALLTRSNPSGSASLSQALGRGSSACHQTLLAVIGVSSVGVRVSSADLR